MAPFLDEFVLPVPQDEIERYRNIAREARRIWRQGSALEYRERTAGNMRAKVGIPRTHRGEHARKEWGAFYAAGRRETRRDSGFRMDSFRVLRHGDDADRQSSPTLAQKKPPKQRCGRVRDES